MKFAKRATWTLALALLSGALVSVAQAQDAQAARMKSALMAPARPQADKDRDAARKPIETIKFLCRQRRLLDIDVW